MTDQLRQRIYTELDALQLIDPHTHINQLSPAATNLAEILGYHYYTELAHSAGLPRERIEEEGIEPRELVARLVGQMEQPPGRWYRTWTAQMRLESG